MRADAYAVGRFDHSLTFAPVVRQASAIHGPGQNFTYLQFSGGVEGHARQPINLGIPVGVQTGFALAGRECTTPLRRSNNHSHNSPPSEKPLVGIQARPAELKFSWVVKPPHKHAVSSVVVGRIYDDGTTVGPAAAMLTPGKLLSGCMSPLHLRPRHADSRERPAHFNMRPLINSVWRYVGPSLSVLKKGGCAEHGQLHLVIFNAYEEIVTIGIPYGHGGGFRGTSQMFESQFRYVGKLECNRIVTA